MSPESVIAKNTISIVNLSLQFPQIIEKENLQEIDNEFREIRNIDFKNFFQNDKNMKVQEFWNKNFTITRGDGTLAFPLMKQLISAILSLPHSSANVERIFSQINLNKNKSRNRLEIETLKGTEQSVIF